MLSYLAAVECDSRAQLASAAISTFLVSPFMFWLAFQRIPAGVRLAALAIGVISLSVDGYLILKRLRAS